MAKRIELTPSPVIFNSENHTYHLGDRELSGITSLLHRQLFPDMYDNVDPRILAQAAAYGTQVHADIEDYDTAWIHNGSIEVEDYARITRENNLHHEASEFLINNDNFASMIDKVYRDSDDTFSIGDIKTYGSMTADKKEQTIWQLSCYAFLLEQQCKKAKVDRLFIIHIRNKEKKDGGFDHIAELIYVPRIPSEIIKELFDCDLRGEQFHNPYGIPEDISAQESLIRSLLTQKATIEEQLAQIKSDILSRMEESDIKTWATDTMRITRKASSTRSSFDLKSFKAGHPEITDYDNYMKTSTVSPSIVITI